jgi:hypothetical protein
MSRYVDAVIHIEREKDKINEQLDSGYRGWDIINTNSKSYRLSFSLIWVRRMLRIGDGNLKLLSSLTPLKLNCIIQKI